MKETLEKIFLRLIKRDPLHAGMRWFEHLVIQLQIKCKTNVMKGFINNCKPPLLINCINVSTPSSSNTINAPAILDPFAPPDLSTTISPDHVPIVSVVDCVAVVAFEYVTSVDYGLFDMFSKTDGDADFANIARFP